MNKSSRNKSISKPVAREGAAEAPSFALPDTVSDPSGNSPLKHHRGRPLKTTNEKSAYAHLVLSERVFKSLHRPASADGSQVIKDAQYRQEVVAKLKEINQDPAANAYYWKLVFTYTFYLYGANQPQPGVADEAGPSPESPRVVSVSQMALAAGLEYHNLKNLFAGKGTVRHLTDYQSFLYEQGIDFMHVQYNPQVVDKAYFYLICLKQTTVTKEALHQLFF